MEVLARPGLYGGLDLVFGGHDVPGAGDPCWVVLLRPVGGLEGPGGLLKAAPAVQLP